MNERIIKLGLDSHMLNYIDNETPRRYFLSGHADEDDLEKFAELIVQECVSICKDRERPNLYGVREVETAIKRHFGVEE